MEVTFENRLLPADVLALGEAGAAFVPTAATGSLDYSHAAPTLIGLP
jgi:hypothetical protein